MRKKMESNLCLLHQMVYDFESYWMRRKEHIHYACFSLWFLFFSAFTLLLLASGESYAGDSGKAPFNVVMIVGDACRPDFLSSYGADAKTPHLDWIRANGVIFERAYAPGPWTAPSSVGIMTGNDSTAYRTMPLQESLKILVPDEEMLLLDALKERGYATRYSVENQNAVIHNNIQGAAPLPESDQPEGALRLSPREIENLTGIYKEGMYGQTYSFLNFILSANPEQPFFAIKWFLDPHQPYKPNHKFRDAIQIDGKSISEILPPEYFSPVPPPEIKPGDFPPALKKALYKASIESVDERVGFILTALEKRNLLSKTVVIFLSDHGELMGEHGLWGHGGFGRNATFYEQIVRVPLIMCGPTLPKGKVVSDPVSLIDLMPSLKQLLDLHYQDDMQGKSFIGSIRGDERLDRELYMSNPNGQTQQDAIIKGDYKLVGFRDGNYALYNVRSDPSEENDISRQDSVRTQGMVNAIVKRRDENRKRREGRTPDDQGYVPKSAKEQKKILNQLKSMGYIK